MQGGEVGDEVLRERRAAVVAPLHLPLLLRPGPVPAQHLGGAEGRRGRDPGVVGPLVLVDVRHPLRESQLLQEAQNVGELPLPDAEVLGALGLLGLPLVLLGLVGLAVFVGLAGLGLGLFLGLQVDCLHDVPEALVDLRGAGADRVERIPAGA